jgi:hypothetical protein
MLLNSFPDDVKTMFSVEIYLKEPVVPVNNPSSIIKFPLSSDAIDASFPGVDECI